MSVLLAAFHDPPVLLLDEPFDGVDPLGVDATLEQIRQARLRGAAVLVSTHLLELAVVACDEAVVLRRGSVVAAAPGVRAPRRRAAPRATASCWRDGPGLVSGATGALLALRWRMVRRPTVRVGLVLLLLVAVAALVVGAMSAAAVPLGAPVDSTDPLQGFRPGGPPPDRTGEVLVLLPSAMLAFFVTSLIGPIAAGGAYELIPASTLVAYPVPPGPRYGSRCCCPR